MSSQIVISVSVVCLVLHFIIWTITDPRPLVKRWEESTEKTRLPKFIKTAIFVAAYLLSSVYLTWPTSSKDDSFMSFGLIVFMLGEAIAVWGRLAMNKNWGIPGFHDQTRQSELVKNGPFAYTRNPIYLGLLCMFIGFSLGMRSYSIFLCALVLYEIYQTILVEEKLLTQRFGEEFTRYREKVPRFL